MNSARMERLDLFRGILAFVVVAYHIPWAFHMPTFQFGFLAVDLFFVLSGIVLGVRYDTRIRSGLVFQEFAWHRLRRLYPMAIIAAGLIAVVKIAGMPELYTAPSPIGTVLSVMFIIPYPASFGLGNSFPADPPVWSLWAELVANVVWFAALRIGRAFTYSLYAVSMTALLFMAFKMGSFDMGANAGFDEYGRALIRALAWFGVGHAISIYKPRSFARTWLLLFALFAACALSQFGTFNGAFAQLLIVISGAALLANLMNSAASGGMTGGFCTFLGVLSYPLYMTHMPATRVARWAIAHGIKISIAYLGAILIVGLIAVVLNESIVNTLPSRFPRLKDFANLDGPKVM